ncbi:MAG: succinate dehydrogenase, cytochrome b556 subunit [Proteobacteria bacterium]|nr:succinate dehydrogenase, cytochrome b556 subunit [Pseudomonadota bacterium]
MSTLAAHRNHPTYWAFVLHRLSGLALALFLPVHLYVLSLVIDGGARFDAFIDWTAHPLVKAAETGLVVLLALHMAGGLRLLAVEFLPWHDRQKTLAALAAGFAFAIGMLFLLNVV